MAQTSGTLRTTTGDSTAEWGYRKGARQRFQWKTSVLVGWVAFSWRTKP